MESKLSPGRLDSVQQHAEEEQTAHLRSRGSFHCTKDTVQQTTVRTVAGEEQQLKLSASELTDAASVWHELTCS